MSVSKYIACTTCKKYLWIGQNSFLYTGEPHTMEALTDFFNNHTTYYPKRVDREKYHELIFLPEPYNGGYENDIEGWKEIDADNYKLETATTALPE